MDYEEFLENYVPELQLIEVLDKLSQFSKDAAWTIDRWVSDSIDERNDELPSHQNPNY